MPDLPSYPALAGADLEVFYGLLARGTGSIAAAKFEYEWQRDAAYIAAIDDALEHLVKGHVVETAAKPRWLDGLVRRELRDASTHSWTRDQFVRVRLLERFGAVVLEADDTYVLAMVSSLGSDKPTKLRADPELIDRAVWRLFEVEGGGEVSLTNVDRFGGDEWRKTLLELVGDGTLDRSRVLEACLRALGRDFAAYRASWFSATYLALKPTVVEISGFQSQLRRLLSAGVPATVAFALKQLLQVHKAGLLEVEETLDALAPAVLAKAKGAALDALRLSLSGESGQLEAVTRVAQTALGNPSSDVQRVAAKWLQDHGGDSDLSALGEAFAPSVQEDLGLRVSPGDDVVAAPMRQPLASPPQPVMKNELAERTAALLEDATDEVELEAVLAAFAVTDTGDALAPLRKRSRQILDRRAQQGSDGVRLSELVARLVLARLGDPLTSRLPVTPAQRFVAHRLEEVARGSTPLLAAPDLPGGWVSPSALVERLRHSPQPRHHDLIAALLRLHPDGRDSVSTANLPAAVKYALDGMEPPYRLLRTRRTGPAAWWLAAERSRAPYGPDRVPRLQAEILTQSWIEQGKEHTSKYTRFSVQTGRLRDPADDQPTELPSADGKHQWGDMGFGDWVPTIASIWPHDAEHFLAIVGLSTLESASWGEVAHDVPRVLDALARHPGRMGTLAVHALAAGLSSTRREYRFHAVDAFCDLVPTGRVSTRDLACALATHAEVWPASRWVESLTAITQKPGGSSAATELLSTLLPRLPRAHRGLKALLDLLRNETLRHGVTVTDPGLRHWLEQITGTSAAARTAALLLK